MTPAQLRKVTRTAVEVVAARAMRRWRWLSREDVEQSCWVAALSVTPKILPDAGEAQVCGFLQLVCHREVVRDVLKQVRYRAKVGRFRRSTTSSTYAVTGQAERRVAAEIDMRRCITAVLGNNDPVTTSELMDLATQYGGSTTKRGLRGAARRLLDEAGR